VRKSRENAAAAGVASRVEFREEDLFKTDLSEATVITLYLLPDVNLELRPRLVALKPGTRIVSHDWDLGDWPPDRTITVDVPDKQVGLERNRGAAFRKFGQHRRQRDRQRRRQGAHRGLQSLPTGRAARGRSELVPVERARGVSRRALPSPLVIPGCVRSAQARNPFIHQLCRLMDSGLALMRAPE